jgi:hypothetical protein
MEKISSLDKENKIKSLEELVLKIGYDSKKCQGSKRVIKQEE